MDLPLQVMPVGGLGEIGMNCMLIGHRDRWIMVDCGIQFPDPWEVGVERRLPDLRMLADWKDRIEAVVITHGHEDHIGALPWVLPVLGDVPVYASSFTRELIRYRLDEHGLWAGDVVTLYSVGETFQAGPFEIEAVRVTHSLPDCASLVLRCEDGTILHTGDWKIDEQPVDGEHFDREAFERIGREGVTLMLSDSTNVLTPGRTRSETEVAIGLREHIEGWHDRVVVTLFASNLHRVRSLAQIAEETGRRLVFAGRSLFKYVEAATVDGRAPVARDRVVRADKLDEIAPARTLLLTTGSQGELNAALGRAARGAHRDVRIGRGDLLLHSARVIPGNEARLYSMFNELGRRGANLVYGRRSGIHASGHAREDELRELIGLVKPGHFIPVHGEYTFLTRHAAVARDAGVPGATVIENGERFSFAAGAHHGEMADGERSGFEDLETLYNYGPATGDRDEMRLSERLRVAWNGLVVVDAEIETVDGRRRAASVELHTRALWLEDQRLLSAMHGAVERSVAMCPGRTPLPEMEEAIRGGIRSLCRKRTGTKPDVVVVLHEGRAS
ncbi:MAG: ribonuclease J [Myxococcota bacterium]